MRQEEIEKMLGKSSVTNPVMLISFKTRKAFKGLFIKTSDYQELSRKNLWRIVSESKISAYNESQNQELAKIFNGAEFTRMELP